MWIYFGNPLYIVKKISDKEITLAPQLEIVGEENTGQVDYAIKTLEELKISKYRILCNILGGIICYDAYIY